MNPLFNLPTIAHQPDVGSGFEPIPAAVTELPTPNTPFADELKAYETAPKPEASNLLAVESTVDPTPTSGPDGSELPTDAAATGNLLPPRSLTSPLRSAQELELEPEQNPEHKPEQQASLPVETQVTELSAGLVGDPDAFALAVSAGQNPVQARRVTPNPELGPGLQSTLERLAESRKISTVESPVQQPLSSRSLPADLPRVSTVLPPGPPSPSSANLSPELVNSRPAAGLPTVELAASVPSQTRTGTTGAQVAPVTLPVDVPISTSVSTQDNAGGTNAQVIKPGIVVSTPPANVEQRSGTPVALESLGLSNVEAKPTSGSQAAGLGVAPALVPRQNLGLSSGLRRESLTLRSDTAPGLGNERSTSQVGLPSAGATPAPTPSFVINQALGNLTDATSTNVAEADSANPAPAAASVSSARSTGLSAAGGNAPVAPAARLDLGDVTNGQWVGRLSQFISQQQATGQPLRIGLAPVELGALELTFNGSGDSLSVTLSAQNGQTRELLESHIDRIKAMLQSQGHVDADVEVAQRWANGQSSERSTPQFGEESHGNPRTGSQESDTDDEPTAAASTPRADSVNRIDAYV